MASVPWRCGQSCTVGPSPRPGMPAGSIGRASTKSTAKPQRRAASVTVTCVSTTCGEHVTYATRPPGRAARNAAVQQLTLQPGQRRQVRRLAAPARLRPAAQRAQPGARRVDEHPVEVPLRQLRVAAHVRPSACSTRHRQPAGGLLHQPRPVLGHLDRGQPRAPGRGQRAEQAGLAARTGAQIQPAAVRAVQRRRRERVRHQLGALVLHVRAAVGHRRAGRPARRRADRPRTARTRRARRPPRRPAPPDRPGPAGRTGAPAGARCPR